MKKTRLTAPQTVTQIYLAALCGPYLLFVGPGGYASIDRSKAAVFAVLTALYLAALAVVLLKSHVQPWHLSCGQRLPAGLLGAYLVFTAVSAAVSPFRAQTLVGASRYEGLFMTGAYVLVCLAVMKFAVPGKWLVYLVSASMTILDGTALLQLRGRNPFHLYPAGLNYYDAGYAYQGEYLGTVGNVDLLAAIVCLALPMMFFYMVLAKEDPWRFFLTLPLLLTSVLCVKMRVMAAFVGLVGGVLFAVPVCLLPAGRKRCKGVLASFGVLVLFAAGLFFVDVGSGTLHEFHQILHGHVEGSYGSDRIAIWREVLALICQRPLFGSGPDTLYLWGRGFESYDPSKGLLIKTTIDAAHNELLNIWVNQGGFAMLSYTGFLLIALKRWLCHIKENTTAALCGAMMLCYLIQSMFGMSTCINAPYFWIVIGMLFWISPPS